MAGGRGTPDSRRRQRLGAAAACLAAVGALASGTGAGLQRSTANSVNAQAAVVPEVLYLEEELAKIATIARVNSDIADEVDVDARSQAATISVADDRHNAPFAPTETGPAAREAEPSADTPVPTPAEPQSADPAPNDPEARPNVADRAPKDEPAPKADPPVGDTDPPTPDPTPTTVVEPGKADPPGQARGHDRTTATVPGADQTTTGAKATTDRAEL
jgi:hypothetical protein